MAEWDKDRSIASGMMGMGTRVMLVCEAHSYRRVIGFISELERVRSRWHEIGMGPLSPGKAQGTNVHFSLHSPYFALHPVKGKRIFFPLAAVSKDPSNCVHGHNREQHEYREPGNRSGEFHPFATGEEFSNRDRIISKVPIM